MPQLAEIVLNDGAATPVAHTFAPVTTDGRSAQLKERVGLPIGYPGLNVNVRPPVQQGDIYKVSLLLTLPSTVTVDGVAKVDYTLTAEVNLMMSNRSTAQNRRDLRVFVANALRHATLQEVIEKLEPLY